MAKKLKNLPFWLLCLLVFSLPFVNFPNLKMTGLPIQATDLLFVLSGAVWLIFLVSGMSIIRLSLLYLPLSLFFASLCLSVVFSEEPKTSLLKLLGNLLLLGLAILTFNLADEEKKIRRLGLVWLAASLLVCLVSFVSLLFFYFWRDNSVLAKTLSHYGSLPTGNYPRIQSTFLNPNMLCNYLSITFAFLLLAFKDKWIKQRILLIFSGFLTIAVFFTVSPGIGGFILMLGIWLWLTLRTGEPFGSELWRRKNLSKICLAGGLLGAVFFFLTTLFSPTDFPDKVEPSPRVLTWISALQTLRENPIVGRGIGLNAAHVVYQSPNGRQILGDAHQLWLNVAAQQGIIGLAAILFLTVWFWRLIYPLDLEKKSLQTALGLAFIGAFCFQGLIGSYEDARHIWVLLGLLASAGKLKEPL